MKKDLSIKKIVFCAILIGIMFVFAWTPLGMIPLGFVSPTTVFIPVAIGIIVLDDWRYSLALGTFFGVVSWIRAMVPAGVLDIYFANPIVSILPRSLMGIVVYFLYQFIKKIKSNALRFSITGGLVALFNTIFTISSLSIVYYNELTKFLLENNMNWGGWLFGVIVLLNMIPEILLGAISSGMICKVLNKIVFLNTRTIDNNE